MQRRAIIVAGAAGPHDVANGVLQRFGFGPALAVSSVAEATALLRQGPATLVVLPLQGGDAAELAALDREARRQQPATLVIGTAAQADPDLILRAMRSGVHEFLVYPPDLKEFSGAVERLTRRTHAEHKAGTTIAVYSAKGGLGTTTVAVNLAVALGAAHPEGRVALVDMIASGGDVRVVLNLRPAYDMGDLLRKVDRIDGELLDSLLTSYGHALWVLPSSDDEETVERFDAAAATNVIEQLQSKFAYTVVDCEHHMSERTLAALDAADRIVLVTQLNVSALRSAQRTLSLFQRLGYGDDKVLVVINRYSSGDVVSLSDAAQLLKREIAFKIPNDYQTASAALTRGVAIAEEDASSQLAWSFSSLAARLNGGPVPNGKNGRNESRLGRLFSRGRK
jgi:pilus assembly protein CpaE